MFDIGFWELALIGMLALVVLGPKRLPEAARAAGKWVGRLRAFVTSVREDIDRQMESGELEELRRLREELGKTRQMIEESSARVYRDMEGIADNRIGGEPSATQTANQTVKSGSGKAKTTKKKKARKKTAGTARPGAAKKTKKKTTRGVKRKAPGK